MTYLSFPTLSQTTTEEEATTATTTTATTTATSKPPCSKNTKPSQLAQENNLTSNPGGVVPQTCDDFEVKEGAVPGMYIHNLVVTVNM